MDYATYSPDDNKLRLYADGRLDPETYARVKAAGFKWAPQQKLFVAPMWTPEREDLLIDLCGEIEDEDTSLTERAEERAERFDGYSERRGQEAERTKAGVSAIADNIPLGQPILVGHHSEKRARKDAERIENGMRKALNLWKTAQYWQSRAKGALAHAKYKERPDVRARRIKGIEADKRKQERNRADAETAITLWENVHYDSGSKVTKKDGTPTTFLERATYLTGRTNTARYGSYSDLSEGKTTPEAVQEETLRLAQERTEWAERWIAHYDNRLVYERAMLEEAGGSPADKFDFAPGGKVRVKGEWRVILRVNKAGGVVNSLTTTPPSAVHWVKSWKCGVEEVSEYQPPTEQTAAKVKKATALPPLCNYPGDGFKEMTKAEWDARYKWSDFPYVGTVAATAEYGQHRRRQTPMGGSSWQKQSVFLTDVKRVDPPAPEQTEAQEVEPVDLPETERAFPQPVYQPRELTPQEQSFAQLQSTLKAGVQVVTSHNLFPTPTPLVRRMVDLADIELGQRVLEPSAGTGNIVGDILGRGLTREVVAVEISQELTRLLAAQLPFYNDTRCTDFLSCNGDLGTFDRIVMNPPFSNGDDIKHIKHALGFLRPGGRLVAICANGPRQNEQLQPLASTWEPLPEDTFKETGTNVRTVLLTIEG